MKMNKRNKVLIIAILLMLTLTALISARIYDRGRVLNTARVMEAVTKETRESLAGVEEDAAAGIEEMIASHVYSHRGSDGAEEHSFKAYDSAIEAGSRYIEQDVVLSADGILYVSHDFNAWLMTGYDGLYEHMSSEAIDNLRTRAGNKILRLSEVFDRYGRSINYVIELKPDNDACVEAFVKLVDEYELGDLITVQSMYPGRLEELETRYPDMPKLFVCRSQAEFYRALDSAYIDIISVKADAGLMTLSNCEEAHDHNKLFSAWILNSEEAIKNAIDMGVDTYFTADTPLALSLEREYGIEEGKRRGKR